MYLLLIEHNPERTRAVTSVLRAAGHRVESAATGGEALAALARPGSPDLVLLEERPPDMPALEFLRAAVRMSVNAGIVILGSEDDAGQWVESTRLGLTDYVSVDPEGAYLTTLAARLDAARQRATDEDRAHRLSDALDSTSAAVLIVDRSGRLEYANAACARLLGRTTRDLSRLGLGDIVALDEEPRLRADLFAAMDVGGEWAGEIDVLRGTEERVPCIVTLSPVRRVGGRIDGLVLTLRDVSDRVAMEDALRAANRRLAEQAARDHLTGIYNRGYFREVLDREVARATRYGDELSVLMLDLDGFKTVNDHRGHDAGDETLQEVAKTVGTALRDGDVLARYGGDEFCVLLPNTDRDAALAVAERLREEIANVAFGPESDIRLTLSLGLSSSRDVEVEPTSQALLRCADQALMEAKRMGGDRVIVHQPRETAEE
ncbi:MAG: GGDEF domain-containing protein [Planctomycetota bacterium]